MFVLRTFIPPTLSLIVLRLEEVFDQPNKKIRTYVAQKWIERPLIVYTALSTKTAPRKSVIRQYVLICGWKPLATWFYRKSLVSI